MQVAAAPRTGQAVARYIADLRRLQYGNSLPGLLGEPSSVSRGQLDRPPPAPIRESGPTALLVEARTLDQNRTNRLTGGRTCRRVAAQCTDTGAHTPQADRDGGA